MNCKQAKEILQKQADDMVVMDQNQLQYAALKTAINILGAYNQVKWERDIAIQQLHDLGVEFGEKISKKDNASQNNPFLKKNWWESQPYCNLELKTEIVDCMKID